MLLLTALAEGADIPPELKTPNYRTRQLTGIGFDPQLERQDPSNVIRAGETCYVWYTQRKTGVHPYASTVYYATSKDGVHWTDQGQALGKGEKGAWPRATAEGQAPHHPLRRGPASPGAAEVGRSSKYPCTIRSAASTPAPAM